MYTKHISLLIEAIIKSSCQRHKVLCLQFKKGCFSSYTKRCVRHVPLFKIAEHVIKQMSIIPSNAVTIQTSGASRDFALYSLEVLRGRQIYHLYFITPINALAFIRTCAKVLP